jgi:hypothetical protein
VTGPDLKELQEDYAKSQSITPETNTGSKPTEKAAREPITFVRPEFEQPAKEEEEDSEEFTLRMMMENWPSMRMISRLSAGGIRIVYDFYDNITIYMIMTFQACIHRCQNYSFP